MKSITHAKSLGDLERNRERATFRGIRGNKEKIHREVQRQKENGITLIALVVTIIVLLILVMVAIAAIIGPNGNVTVTENGTSIGGKEEPVTATQSLVGSDVQYKDIDGDPSTADWKLFYVVPEQDETTEVANEDAGAYYLITSDYLDCSTTANFPTGSNSAYSNSGMTGDKRRLCPFLGMGNTKWRLKYSI